MSGRGERAERDKLAAVIEAAYDLNPGMASFELLAHAVLAAGYRKPEVFEEWGAAHKRNDVVYRYYGTRQEAQDFIDKMAEVDHAMVLKRRTHTPATTTEWETAA